MSVRRFIIAVLFVSVILTNAHSEPEGFDFRKTTWGMTISDVRHSEKSIPLASGNSALTFADTVANFRCTIVYRFIEDKLWSCEYQFPEKHIVRNDYVSDFNFVKEVLTRKYRAPKSNSVFWLNNYYRNIAEYKGLAVCRGHLRLGTRWETERTTIDQYLYGENLEITHRVLYTCKEFREKAEKYMMKDFIKEF